MSDEGVVSISVTAVPPEIGAKYKQFENVLGATKGPALKASSGEFSNPMSMVSYIGIDAHDDTLRDNERKLLNCRAFLR